RKVPAIEVTNHPKLRRVRATFKWSRDNGSVATLIEKFDGVTLTVHDLGPDVARGFDRGQLVEISDDPRGLARRPAELRQVVEIDEALRKVTLSLSPAKVDGKLHPKLRRWDGLGAVTFGSADGWVSLESGVQVQFDGGTANSGDYWQIPARTATADAQ